MARKKYFREKSWNEKTELERFQTLVDDIYELVWGTPRRPEKPDIEDIDMSFTPVKPKRARTKKGKYKADDKKTKDVNEAWVGGKGPKRRRKK